QDNGIGRQAVRSHTKDVQEAFIDLLISKPEHLTSLYKPGVPPLAPTAAIRAAVYSRLLEVVSANWSCLAAPAGTDVHFGLRHDGSNRPRITKARGLTPHDSNRLHPYLLQFTGEYSSPGEDFLLSLAPPPPSKAQVGPPQLFGVFGPVGDLTQSLYF